MKVNLLLFLSFIISQSVSSQTSVETDIAELNRIFVKLMSNGQSEDVAEKVLFSYEGCDLLIEKLRRDITTDNLIAHNVYYVHASVVEPSHVKGKWEQTHTYEPEKGRFRMGIRPRQDGMITKTPIPLNETQKQGPSDWTHAVPLGEWNDRELLADLHRARDLLRKVISELKSGCPESVKKEQERIVNDILSQQYADYTEEARTLGKEPEQVEIEEAEEPVEVNHRSIVTDFMSLDEKPSFPGGKEEMLRFIERNLKYPSEAKDAGIVGTVYIAFSVDTDGSLSDFSVLRGTHSSLDEEALRIAQLMPKWEPGKNEGKVLKASSIMPVKFEL